MPKLYYAADADHSLIADRKVAILGYGSQGHAHALNLRDSGIDVRVALRPGSGSRVKAEEAGFRVLSNAEAAAEADLVMLLLPDTDQARVYDEEVAPNLNSGDALFFAHGFNIRYGTITPPPGVDVAMVAPKGPGHLVRRTYTEGGGVPSLIAVAQDATGGAMPLALAYADAIGATRAGVLETTFTEETETDLFGEQVVLCGGLTRGPRIVSPAVKAEMRKVLDEIQDGTFAKEWIAENAAGRPRYEELRKAGQTHQIEQIGAELRAMMPFITAGRQRLEDVSGG